MLRPIRGYPGSIPRSMKHIFGDKLPNPCEQTLSAAVLLQKTVPPWKEEPYSRYFRYFASVSFIFWISIGFVRKSFILEARAACRSSSKAFAIIAKINLTKMIIAQKPLYFNKLIEYRKRISKKYTRIIIMPFNGHLILFMYLTTSWF